MVAAEIGRIQTLGWSPAPLTIRREEMQCASLLPGGKPCLECSP